MAITMTTLAEIRAFTGITTAQLSDPNLTRVAEAAEAYIARKCNRPSGFITNTYTELVNGYGQDYVYVIYSPITAITSIKDYFGASDTVTITSTDYTFETDYSGKIVAYNGSVNSDIGTFETGQPLVRTMPPTGLFRHGGRRKNIEVIYTGGYADASSVPEDLSQAVIETVKWMADRRLRDPGLTSENLGQYSYSRAPAAELDRETGMPMYLAELIRPYIRRMRA